MLSRFLLVCFRTELRKIRLDCVVSRAWSSARRSGSRFRRGISTSVVPALPAIGVEAIATRVALLDWRPSLFGWRPSLLGWRPTLLSSFCYWLKAILCPPQVAGAVVVMFVVDRLGRMMNCKPLPAFMGYGALLPLHMQMAPPMLQTPAGFASFPM